MFLLLGLLPMLLYFLGAVGALYVALRFVRAFELRGVDRAELQELRSRVARLEEETDRAAGEIRELEDGQRFTTRVLAERSGGVAPPAT